MTHNTLIFILGWACLAVSQADAEQASPLEKAFAMADANHDGVVSRSEFQASRAARFRQLDRNHDGYLSEDDMPSGLFLLRPNAPRMMEMLSAFDTDHDGRISPREFVDGSMLMFDRADVNHDGVLTHAEAAAAAATFKSVLNARK